MEITEKCTGCGECLYICPEEAIFLEGKMAKIDLEKCVECYTCLKSKICPVNAFKASKLEWPRSIRMPFSVVMVEHKETRIPGRGTEETKTNDVTGRFKVGELAFSIDVGRPGIGTTFKDVETIALQIAKLGVEFEEKNPVTFLMVDKKTGKLKEDILNERVHSAIIEFKAPISKLYKIVDVLKDVSDKVETVYSVGVGSVLSKEGNNNLAEMLDREGIYYRPNGKLNIGLGRPLADVGV